jgi:hypothetical protein
MLNQLLFNIYQIFAVRFLDGETPREALRFLQGRLASAPKDVAAARIL